ncbi:MAG: O-antigen ligase family protein [Candidatus Falkowbacteria bacterium]
MEVSTMLLALFIGLYFFLAKLRPDWAVMLLLASLPFYQVRFVFAGIPATLLELMILVSFAAFCIFHTKFLDIIRRKHTWRDIKETRDKRGTYPFALEITCLLFLSYGAAAWAGFSDEALGIWKAYFYEPVLVFILILNVFQFNGKAAPGGNIFGKILWPLCLSAFVVSLIAILQKFGLVLSPENFWPRVTGPFPYPNALGLYLGPLVLVMAGWLMGDFRSSIFDFRSKNYKGLLLVLTILASLTAIFLARSEGALVGIAAGAAVFGLMWHFSCSRYGKFIPIMAVSTMMILIMYSPLILTKLIPDNTYLNSRASFLNYAADKAILNDLSGEIRKQQWRETWEMLKGGNRWFWGTGISGYQAAIAPYHQEGIFFNIDRDPDFRRKIVNFDERYKSERWQPVEVYLYPHNIFLNFWTELGLVGALFFVWIIIKFFFTGIRHFKPACELPGRGDPNKYLNFGLMGAMTAIIVHGIVDVPYFKNDLAVMFWILLALMSILKLQGKDAARKSS